MRLPNPLRLVPSFGPPLALPAPVARSIRPGPQRSQAGAVRTAPLKVQCKAPTHNGLTQTVMSATLHWPGTVLSRRGVVKF